MPATFKGVHFFVTYSQNAFDLDSDFGEFRSWLESTLAPLKYLLIGCEKHSDGGDHWHCVISFNKQVAFGARGLDYRGTHPNIQPVGRRVDDWNRCTAYVTKDGHSREWGTPRHKSDSVWSLVVNARSRDQALDLVASEAPRDYVLNRRNLDYALDKMWPVQDPSTFKPRQASSFRIPDELVRWVSGSLEYA